MLYGNWNCSRQEWKLSRWKIYLRQKNLKHSPSQQVLSWVVNCIVTFKIRLPSNISVHKASQSAESCINYMNSSAQPNHKRCVVDCLFPVSNRSNAKISNFPTTFERVFEADPRQEQINCNFRVSGFNASHISTF